MQAEKPNKSIFERVFTRKIKRQHLQAKIEESSGQPSAPGVPIGKMKYSDLQTVEGESPSQLLLPPPKLQVKPQQNSTSSIVDQFRNRPLYQMIGEDWLDFMNFDHFFTTLKSKDELPDCLQLLVKLNGYSQLDDGEEDKPRFMRKRKLDKDWQYRKGKSANSESEIRRSDRIEKIQAKEEMETRMMEMGYAFHSASYRYSHKQVEFRLSYLQANALKPWPWQEGRAEVPDHPEYRKLQVSQLQKTMQQKLSSLQSRMIK